MPQSLKIEILGQNGDMRLLIGLMSLIVFFEVRAQDERLFRELFLYDLRPIETVKQESVAEAKYQINTPLYQVDLNGDDKKDGFVFEKRDGVDWLHFFNQDNKLVKSFKLSPKGINSNVFKLRMSELSANTRLIEVFYYQGFTKYTRMDSTAKVLLLTIDDRDLNTLALFNGPEFFQEARDIKQNYFLREYELNLDDLDHDGVKEYITKHARMSRVYKYLGKGSWKIAF